jgi:hypothetical protein
MKKVIFLCLVFLFFSCDKVKQYNKVILGSWTIKTVMLKDKNDFTFYDFAPQGNFEFKNNQLASGSVNASFHGLYGTFYDSFAVNGNYYLDLEKQEFNLVNGNDTLHSRLFLLTKSDLEFEFYDSIQGKRVRYSFKKSK